MKNEKSITMLRSARALAILFLLLGLSLWALSCERGGREGGAIGAADVPDQEFSDFMTVESDSGVVKWILKAPVARIYNARKLLVTDSPRIEFFDELGALASVLTSNKGEYNQVTHDLTALGSVVITSEEGYVLETESLVWIEKLGEIHSENFVKFTRGNDVLTGYGLRGDPDLKNVEILRDVRAYLRDDGGFFKQELQKDEQPRENSHD